MLTRKEDRSPHTINLGRAQSPGLAWLDYVLGACGSVYLFFSFPCTHSTMATRFTARSVVRDNHLNDHKMYAHIPSSSFLASAVTTTQAFAYFFPFLSIHHPDARSLQCVHHLLRFFSFFCDEVGNTLDEI